jgi:hypothetical protein
MVNAKRQRNRKMLEDSGLLQPTKTIKRKASKELRKSSRRKKQKTSKDDSKSWK